MWSLGKEKFYSNCFSIHNEPGKNRNRCIKNKELANQFYKEREADNPGFQRVKQLTTNKISMAIQMVKDAIKTGFEPAYVLADSWFICDTFASEIKKIKIRYAKKLLVIGIMKTNRFIIINGINVTASLVPDYKRKDIRYCKKQKCNYLAIRIEYKGNKLKAFWV